MDKSKRRDRLLIVDDEQINLSVLTQMLSQEYELLLAQGAEQAIRIAETEQPDIILLDVLMPGMDGFEAIAALKENEKTMHIPVIFITGLDDSQSEERGLMLGAADYITKPYNPIIVKARVAMHMRTVHQTRLSDTAASFDALTDLANRKSFDLSLTLEAGRSARDKKPLSLIVIDVDNFKQYNHLHSYIQGDQFLKAVADAMTSSVCRATDLPVRLGNDEFAVLLPGTDLDGALHVAEKIRSAVEQLQVSTFENKNTTETVSIGVACKTFEPGQLPDSLVNLAREKMRQARSAGGNCIVS